MCCIFRCTMHQFNQIKRRVGRRHDQWAIGNMRHAPGGHAQACATTTKTSLQNNLTGQAGKPKMRSTKKKSRLADKEFMCLPPVMASGAGFFCGLFLILFTPFSRDLTLPSPKACPWQAKPPLAMRSGKNTKNRQVQGMDSQAAWDVLTGRRLF